MLVSYFAELHEFLKVVLFDLMSSREVWQKKSSPDLGGGCAGQREGAGRGTLPNVAMDNPAGLVSSKMSKVWILCKKYEQLLKWCTSLIFRALLWAQPSNHPFLVKHSVPNTVLNTVCQRRSQRGRDNCAKILQWHQVARWGAGRYQKRVDSSFSGERTIDQKFANAQQFGGEILLALQTWLTIGDFFCPWEISSNTVRSIMWQTRKFVIVAQTCTLLKKRGLFTQDQCLNRAIQFDHRQTKWKLFCAWSV